MKSRSVRVLGPLACLVPFVFVPCIALAQNNGGQNPGGDTGQIPTGQIPGTGQTPGNVTTPTPQQQTQSGGQGDFMDLGSFLEGFNIAPETEPIVSERLQPFVGPSIENFTEQNLVHPRSQIAPGSGGQSASGSRAGGNRGAAQSGATSGFEIVRGGIRTRLVPRFPVARTQPVSVAISTNFNSRLNRLPVAQTFAGNVNLIVDGRKGTLIGSVSNEDERARVERLARMEPGIYQIDNQITVSGQ